MQLFFLRLIHTNYRKNLTQFKLTYFIYIHSPHLILKNIFINVFHPLSLIKNRRTNNSLSLLITSIIILFILCILCLEIRFLMSIFKIIKQTFLTKRFLNDIRYRKALTSNILHHQFHIKQSGLLNSIQICLMKTLFRFLFLQNSR